MTSLAIRAFGGMLPARDNRLLPDAAAELAINTWLYSGSIEGIVKPRAVHTLVNPHARSVFRIPMGSPRIDDIEQSKWLEFEALSTTVVRSPVNDVDDARYYIADGLHPPRYTTYSRVVEGLPTLLLGVPTPYRAPEVSAAGGWQLQEEIRSYTYTWVTKYLEEGPPAEPSAPVTARTDATWTIIVPPPRAEDTSQRELAFVNIYRTVTSAQNISVFYFVAQMPIADTKYIDVLTNQQVLSHSPLPSTFWAAPPDKLGGLTTLPNGMIAGFVGQEIWYCEPFRPHAWPPQYQTSVDYNIVGMAALDQILVIGTDNLAYVATGVHPSAVSSRIVTGSEPCASQGSFAVVPQGVIYSSRHGLMLANTGGATNITKPFISADDWAKLINLNLISAAILNGAYYAFSGIFEGSFQANAFQTDAFQIDAPEPSTDGVLIEFNDPRVAVSKLRHPTPTFKVIQDVWTAEVLLLRDGKVWLLDLPNGDPEEHEWKSKLFQLTKPQNMAVAKVIYSSVDGPNTGKFEVFAGGKLRLSRPLPVSGKPFRLPSGFKSDNWQVRYVGTLAIDQIEVATSVQELSQV